MLGLASRLLQIKEDRNFCEMKASIFVLHKARPMGSTKFHWYTSLVHDITPLVLDLSGL